MSSVSQPSGMPSITVRPSRRGEAALRGTGGQARHIGIKARAHRRPLADTRQLSERARLRRSGASQRSRHGPHHHSVASRRPPCNRATGGGETNATVEVRGDARARARDQQPAARDRRA